VGLLSKEMLMQKVSQPIVVGGMAVELYTQGSYTTGDIDLKAPKEPLKEILTRWGFINQGRLWLNKELDIYVDWLGEDLEEGPEALQRLNTLVIDEGLQIKVISIEDLIIDRLKAYKWWRDEDSFLWARVLVEVKKVLAEPLEVEYLRRRAAEEEIEDILESLFKKAG